MTVKSQVLVLLENSKNAALSGEYMAEQIGCTRAAVWKAIKSLQEEGYVISGVKNRGYTLSKSGDKLSEGCIRKQLDEKGITIPIICEKTTDSTNTQLKRMVAEGEKRDLCLISEAQTGGRGRHGRSFYSPDDTGIYFSFLLHPNVSAMEATFLTTMAAVAEAKAIDDLNCTDGYETQIKWVNDLLVRNKKITGILTESSISMEDYSLEYVIVGIGINLYEPAGGFPADIKDTAGAIVTGNSPTENLKNNIVAKTIINFMNYYKDFPKRSYMEDYRRKCFVLGKPITLLNSDHSERIDARGHSRGVAIDVADDGRLLVEYPDGIREYISSGEISVRI